MQENSWMNNPMLKDIDPLKLQMLSSFANEAGSKKQSEMLPFFLSAMNQSNEKGAGFNSNEKDLLLGILMEQLSPNEKQKAETILRMTSAFKKP